MTAGNLERLLVKDKAVLAKTLIPQIKPGKNQDRLLWTWAVWVPGIFYTDQ